ncbi:MAG: hypothetical protein FWH56_10590 [Betaproteobacteria bacterium]|nr:hypothetical protein [Betaproteobacteria bacterium]MCL2162314.1 hypothetical protein [Betaproteobacteria bacterium]
MNIRRTGIPFLLAGIFAVLCLSFNAPVTPSGASCQAARPAPNEQSRSGARAPRASSQAARSAPRNNGTSVTDIEATLKNLKNTEQELQSRLRDVENLRKKLREQADSEPETIKRLQSQIRELEEERSELLKRLPSNASQRSVNWMLGGAALFTFALCVILLLRMNRPKTFDESMRWEEPTSHEHSSPHFDSIPSAPDTETGARPLSVQPLAPSLPDWDSASPALDAQSLKALEANEAVWSRDPTIELAEIMLSYGRINSAAEALANFIENNPKEAFVPWLKLLEVYRANGQRTEFDKIARKLNKTFNVWTVDWDNFNDALTPVHGLETMTHIVKRLQNLWGTRKCQAYLQYLLRDTRDETRQGFPLAAIDDILCLSDTLEHYLGPYTGPINAFRDLMDTAPPTETEGNKSDVHAQENGAEQEDTDKPQADEGDKIQIQEDAQP